MPLTIDEDTRTVRTAKDRSTAGKCGHDKGINIDRTRLDHIVLISNSPEGIKDMKDMIDLVKTFDSVNHQFY